MQQCNLVLSGGGARGFAHLGVIKALQEKGFSFSAISATSSGAMVAVLLCDGYSIDEITEMFRESLPITRFNFHFTQSLLSIESLNKILNKYLYSKTFEELKHPLFVSTTDVNTGKQVIFNSGELIPAVVASSSIPIIFPNVFINGNPYADGGISGNLPVEPFLNSNLKTIGVHVNPLDKYNAELSAIRQLERIVHLSIRENVIREMEKVEILIEPPELVNYGLFDTNKMDEIIKIGYNYTIQQNIIL